MESAPTAEGMLLATSLMRRFRKPGLSSSGTKSPQGPWRQQRRQTHQWRAADGLREHVLVVFRGQGGHHEAEDVKEGAAHDKRRRAESIVEFPVHRHAQVHNASLHTRGQLVPQTRRTQTLSGFTKMTYTGLDGGAEATSGHHCAGSPGTTGALPSSRWPVTRAEDHSGLHVERRVEALLSGPSGAGSRRIFVRSRPSSALSRWFQAEQLRLC